MCEMKFNGLKIATKEYSTNVVHILKSRSDTCLTNHIMLINTISNIESYVRNLIC